MLLCMYACAAACAPGSGPQLRLRLPVCLHVCVGDDMSVWVITCLVLLNHLWTAGWHVDA